MPTPDDIRRLYTHNRAVLDRHIRALQRMPWKTVTRNLETGHRTMKDTIVHILRAHDGWLNYVAKGRVSKLRAVRAKQGPYDSWEKVLAFRDEVWVGLDELLADLDEKKLRRRVKAPWMPGNYTLADAVMQASIEQAHHLGEIIAVLWQMDREPPDMTWIENRGR